MSSYGSMSPADEGFDRYEPAFYCAPHHQGSPMGGAVYWTAGGAEGHEVDSFDLYHDSAHYIGRTHGYEEMQMQNEPYDGYHHHGYPQNGTGMECALPGAGAGAGAGPGGSFVRVVKRRSTANKKERRRTQSINTAFSDLRDCIPNVPPDTKLSKMVRKRSQDINAAFSSLRRHIPHVLPDTKMTKIKTLRLATSYISYLLKALQTDTPCAAFRADTAHAPARRRHDTQGSERRGKGRTGWPQHVWALELNTEPSLHS